MELNRERKKEIEDRLEIAKRERASCLDEHDKLASKLSGYKTLIKTLNEQLSEELYLDSVSDHAVVRYLSRIDGVDIEKIREKILDLNKPSNKMIEKNIYFNDEENITLVFKGEKIITVYQGKGNND
jgi:hypothetical protein